MEVKLFVYDKTLRPDTFLKTFKLDSVKYEPSFSYVRLIKTMYKYFALEEGFSNFLNFTFGTLYTFECTDTDWNNIKLYYCGNGELKLDKIKVRTIKFDNIEDFLKQKFEVTSVQECYCFTSDLSNKQMRILSEARSRYCGNLCPEFLQTYRY